MYLNVFNFKFVLWNLLNNNQHIKFKNKDIRVIVQQL